MDRFAQDLLKALPRAFESEEYALEEGGDGQEGGGGTARPDPAGDGDGTKKGFTIQPSPQGIQLTPIKSGHTIHREHDQPAEEDGDGEKKAELEHELRQSLRPLIEIGRATEAAMEKLNKEVVGNAVGPLLTEPRETFKKNPKVSLTWTRSWRMCWRTFQPSPTVLPQMMQQQPQGQDGRPVIPVDHTKDYRVNLFVDNSELKGGPNIFEPSPTFTHMFGFSEKEVGTAPS